MPIGVVSCCILHNIVQTKNDMLEVNNPTDSKCGAGAFTEEGGTGRRKRNFLAQEDNSKVNEVFDQ